MNLEAEQRRRIELRYPPRVGLVLGDNYPTEAELLAATAAEHAKPGTVGRILIKFVDAEDGLSVAFNSGVLGDSPTR